MTLTRLTPDEHAILYFESASNVYRQHKNIKPKEVDKLVQVEMHSMNLAEARELITKIKMGLQTKYHGDALMIRNE
ncbi:MAG: hypothetical protein AAFQ41_03155 [Cyanobacteria bacterium J06623_7]